jgi:predicted pyridoxine 5'-phosphate oxidase superfamily flavin-nucleotide-binding protein
MKINNKLKNLIETNVISLSTTSKSNYPHIIYVALVKCIDANKLLITDNYMVETKENILKNNKVSIALLADGCGYELVGTAEYFFDGEYIEYVKKLVENNNLPCKGAILINVEKIKKMA